MNAKLEQEESEGRDPISGFTDSIDVEIGPTSSNSARGDQSARQ